MDADADATGLRLSPAPSGVETAPVLRQPFFHHTDAIAAPLSSIVHSYLTESAVRCGRRHQPSSMGDAHGGSQRMLDTLGTDALATGGFIAAPHSEEVRDGGNAVGARGAGQRKRTGLSAATLPPVSKRLGKEVACRTSRRPSNNLSSARTGAKEERRYRRIEDLAYYVNTGTVTDDTFYFLDPMQRRTGWRKELALPEQVVADDPRVLYADAAGLDDGRVDKAAAILPRGLLSAKRQFDSSAGQVRPYALGRGHTVKRGQVVDLTTMENAMDAFVLRMQCQRPTKGLRSYTY